MLRLRRRWGFKLRCRPPSGRPRASLFPGSLTARILIFLGQRESMGQSFRCSDRRTGPVNSGATTTPAQIGRVAPSFGFLGPKTTPPRYRRCVAFAEAPSGHPQSLCTDRHSATHVQGSRDPILPSPLHGGVHGERPGRLVAPRFRRRFRARPSQPPASGSVPPQTPRGRRRPGPRPRP